MNFVGFVMNRMGLWIEISIYRSLYALHPTLIFSYKNVDIVFFLPNLIKLCLSVVWRDVSNRIRTGLKISKYPPTCSPIFTLILNYETLFLQLLWRFVINRMVSWNYIPEFGLRMPANLPTFQSTNPKLYDTRSLNVLITLVS